MTKINYIEDRFQIINLHSIELFNCKETFGRSWIFNTISIYSKQYRFYASSTKVDIADAIMKPKGALLLEYIRHSNG